MTYKDEIIKAMKWLAEDKRTVFIGQSTRFKGTGLFWTLSKVPIEKRIELPVFEDIQLGMSIGMSLEGLIPISIYPRMDFLILAYNQLFNHLDLMEEMSDGQFKPGIIIRTAIGSVKPLFPGPQHNKDHTSFLKAALKNVKTILLEKSENIMPFYKKAFQDAINGKSTILIEIPDKYNEK